MAQTEWHSAGIPERGPLKEYSEQATFWRKKKRVTKSVMKNRSGSAELHVFILEVITFAQSHYSRIPCSHSQIWKSMYMISTKFVCTDVSKMAPKISFNFRKQGGLSTKLCWTSKEILAWRLDKVTLRQTDHSTQCRTRWTVVQRTDAHRS